MKPLWFIFVAAMTLSSFAADISLKDGRVLKDAVVKSQAPRTVTIKHAGGLSSIAKSLLPPELLAQYPFDEAAAHAADKKALLAREAALNARKTESGRLARLRTERDATVAAYEANQAKESVLMAPKIAAVKNKAQPLIEKYFEREYSLFSNGVRTASVSIEEVRPIDGADGRWFMTGHTVISIRSVPSGLPYNSSFQLGGDTTEQWRDQYNAHQMDQQRYQDDKAYNRAAHDNQNCPSTPANHPGDSHHSHGDREVSELPLFFTFTGHQESRDNVSSESRNFEATYMIENGTPSISVTVR